MAYNEYDSRNMKYILTLIVPGFNLRTEVPGGGRSAPQCKIFSAPLKSFFSLFFLMIQGVPRTYLGKVRKSGNILLWLSGLKIFFTKRGGRSAPPPGTNRVKSKTNLKCIEKLSRQLDNDLQKNYNVSDILKYI